MNASDLVDFINAAPTPYHAVAETARRLEGAGYTPLDEKDTWALEAGAKHYVVRNEGSIIAFELGSGDVEAEGVRIVGAHSDSPNLRINPRPDRTAHGVKQLTIEPYGGILAHTWFDRDCSIAGRVTIRTADGERSTVLVDFERPLLRVSNLAIHLQRELYEQGFKPNWQEHMQPLLGLEGTPDLEALLEQELDGQGHAGVESLAYDLMLYDVQPAALGGASDAFVHAPRLDNLGSCHAALSALLAGGGSVPFTRVIVFWDHEEIGSRSAHGAAGPFLRDVVSRIAGGGESLRRALSQSTMISADMAHGVHPNYPDKHDPEHAPLLGKGPVIKWNVNQSYTSDAVTAGMFAALCADAGVEHQDFRSRGDTRCGSTIGPVNAAVLGVRTVDVGNPMLSMHSCREMCAAADVEPMIEVMRAYFETRG